MIMLTGLGNDIHTVALRLFDIEFQELQCKTINLGTAVHPRDIINSCKKYEPSLLIITTTNGELLDWIEDLKPLFSLKKRPYVMLGGIFCVGEYDDIEMETKLIGFGFDEVYSRRGNIRKITERALELSKSQKLEF